jgi:hypothetical protein
MKDQWQQTAGASICEAINKGLIDVVLPAQVIIQP